MFFKKIVFCCFFILVTTVFNEVLSKSIVQPIHFYSFEIPAGWDTLPKYILKKNRFSANLIASYDFFLHPSIYKDTLKPPYAFFRFVPIQHIQSNTLTQLTNRIILDVKEELKWLEKKDSSVSSSALSDISIDSLSGTVGFIKELSFFKRGSLVNKQKIFFTKEGYISLNLVYLKNREADVSETFDRLLRSFNLEQKYALVNPKGGSSIGGISFINLIFSLGIGLLVFLLIQFWPKIFKLINPKLKRA